MPLSKHLSLFLPLMTLFSLNAQEMTQTQKSPAKEQESLIDALKDIEIGGFTYSQYTSLFGKDANGDAMQFRLWLDLETGTYHNFSIGSRIFANMGTGGPDGGTLLVNSGLSEESFSPTDSIPLTLMSLYGKQFFQDSQTTITLGKINIITPFTDYQWDFGYGIAFSNNKIENITLHFESYGVWGLDDYSNIHSSPYADDGNSFSSDKPLIIWGLDGTNLNGFGFDFWLAHAFNTIDFLVFADFNYTFSDLTLQAQLATTQIDLKHPRFSKQQNGVEVAKLRGLYNVQAKYETNAIGITAGYTGSFGDGYGALFNYTAGFNMGGNIWWDVGSGNGYAFTGVGGVKAGQKANISVAYAQLDYHDKIFASLSYAYISGNNQYRLTQKAYSNHQNNPNITLGGSLNAKLHEVSAILGYSFTDKLSVRLLAGSTFGDLVIGKAQTSLFYTF